MLLLVKKIDKIKIVVNGAGASAMACTNLFKRVSPKKITMVDRKGVIFRGRDNLTNGNLVMQSIHTIEH